MKRICIIGLGYVGLPTAALVAERYETVLGVDINKELILELQSGKTRIEEPGLSELLNNGLGRGSLRYSSCIEDSDVYVIAVPTPFKSGLINEIPSPDISFVHSVVDGISPHLKKGDLVILESTSPIGTTVEIAAKIQDQRPDLSILGEYVTGDPDIHFAYCPERVLPGNALDEVRNNSRVIGGLTDRCASVAKAFYKLFVNGECVETSSAVAEAVKLSENSFRDVNIAFANELSLICDRYSISTKEVIKIANMHPRVNILNPGVGVGGHCIAVDPWFLISDNRDLAQLMYTSRKVNMHKTSWVVNQIQDHVLKLAPPEKNIILYGLAYKPDIKDLRESPSVDILNELKASEGVNVLCVEPNIYAKEICGCKNISVSIATKMDGLHVILVAHKEFSEINFDELFHIDYR